MQRGFCFHPTFLNTVRLSRYNSAKHLRVTANICKDEYKFVVNDSVHKQKITSDMTLAIPFIFAHQSVIAIILVQFFTICQLKNHTINLFT